MERQYRLKGLWSVNSKVAAAKSFIFSPENSKAKAPANPKNSKSFDF
jgi:hypothetical protein